MLLAVRPPEWALFAPQELAEIGSCFVVSLGCVDGLNCVIGPYKNEEEAKAGTRRMLQSGGVFEASDDHFVGVVRHARQDDPERSQTVILERIW
jgi:hypothetical protein